MKKILVLTDFSAESKIALKQAALLAKKSKAELHLLYVIEDRLLAFSDSPESPQLIFNIVELKKKVCEKLDELQTYIFVKMDVLTWNHIRKGDVYTEVMQLCNRRDIDLIVMSETYWLNKNTDDQKKFADSKIKIFTYSEFENSSNE